MSSLFLPSLGAMPLRTAFAGSPQPYPVNHYAPGQIWVARASDAETLTTRREPADAPDLQALIAEPALDALRQSRARLLVVRDARQQALACGAVLLREDCAELQHMAVLPLRRGKGLGGTQLGALEQEAMRAGRPLLRVRSDVREHAGQRFFERLGFERCGPFGAYRADPFTVYMEKLLG